MPIGLECAQRLAHTPRVRPQTKSSWSVADFTAAASPGPACYWLRTNAMITLCLILLGPRDCESVKWSKRTLSVLRIAIYAYQGRIP
jgi:hypothetical protein